MEKLTFDEYQEKAAGTAIYKRNAYVVYPLIGIINEAAEVAEHAIPDIREALKKHDSFLGVDLLDKFEAFVTLGLELGVMKKKIRDKWDELTPADQALMTDLSQTPDAVKTEKYGKEVGDVMWYVAAFLRDIDADMSYYAQDNLNKLAARKARNTLQGSGDSR